MNEPAPEITVDHQGLGQRLRYYAGSKRTYRVLVLLVLTYFFPLVMTFWFVCGFLDIMRNTRREKDLFLKYFIGSGSITWVFAPLNLLLDLLSLPYWNKGVWQLEDLPDEEREEIVGLLKTMDESTVVEQLQGKLTGNDREMIFWKWSGKNLETSIDMPEFHKKYKYIVTIGISTFNSKRSTSKHFGVFRTMFRVLYNLNPIESEQTYIDVGNVRNYWSRNRLFIFDDTLFHQSINETDEPRYCAFIDIVRPSAMPWLMRGVVAIQGAILLRVRHLFYNAWSFVK